MNRPNTASNEPITSSAPVWNDEFVGNVALGNAVRFVASPSFGTVAGSAVVTSIRVEAPPDASGIVTDGPGTDETTRFAGGTGTGTGARTPAVGPPATGTMTARTASVATRKTAATGRIPGERSVPLILLAGSGSYGANRRHDDSPHTWHGPTGSSRNDPAALPPAGTTRMCVVG